MRYKKLGVLVIVLLCIGAALFPLLSVLVGSFGRIEHGRKFGVAIGDTGERATDVLKERYGNASNEKFRSCFGEGSTGNQIVVMDNSWRNGVICIEMHNDLVKSINWKFKPLTI